MTTDKARFAPLFAAAVAAAACIPATSQPPAAPIVGRSMRAWADESRPNWATTGPRPLSIRIWFPAAAGSIETDWLAGPPDAPLFRMGRSAESAAVAAGPKRPLVLLSHGTGGSAAMLAWLGEALARAGYIVAAPNHHGNTSEEPIPTPEGFRLWWERPVDLSRVLDQLLADAELGSLIDADRIGAAGFSLGGYTVVAMAGGITSLARYEAFCAGPLRDFTCERQPEFPDASIEFEKVRERPDVRASLARHGDSYRDPRVVAIYALAPVGTPLTDASLAAVSVPVRIVVGDQDRTTPPSTNGRRIATLIPRATLRVLPGVGHYTFLAECLPAARTAVPSLCAEQAGVDRVAVHRDVAADAVAYFNDRLARR